MYVLFNEQGQLITKIPHGDAIRQNSTYHIYVCFEKGQFNPNEKFLTIKIKKNNNTIGNEVFVNDYYYDNFKKLENELIFGFEDGKEYLIYDFFVNFQTYPEAVNNYGNLEASIILYNKETKDIYAKGIITYYVEKTMDYNNKYISPSQYQYLLQQIANNGGSSGGGGENCNCKPIEKDYINSLFDK